MKANMLSWHTSSTPGVGVKRSFFSFLKVVILHIKLKGIEHIYCPYTHLPPLRSKGHFFFFSESGHVAYQIKVKEV